MNRPLRTQIEVGRFPERLPGFLEGDFPGGDKQPHPGDKRRVRRAGQGSRELPQVFEHIKRRRPNPIQRVTPVQVAMNMWTEVHQIGNLTLVSQDRRPYLDIHTDCHTRMNRIFFIKRCFGVGFLTPDNPDCKAMTAS